MSLSDEDIGRIREITTRFSRNIAGQDFEDLANLLFLERPKN